MKKFYEFKCISSTEANLFIYGEIVSKPKVDFWTGEKDETSVDLLGFKEELEKLGNNIKTLNIFINSPGGDVFVASTMVSLLERLKNDGVRINAYVDGISASAASYLMMEADKIYLYKNSVVMIHKPITYAYGNADVMQKTIEMLNKIEDSVLMPLYNSKAKISEEKIKTYLSEEKWFSANDMIKDFDVEILNNEQSVKASFDINVMNRYKNVPVYIQNLMENQKTDIKNIVQEVNEEDKSNGKIKIGLELLDLSLRMKEREEKYENNEINGNS